MRGCRIFVGAVLRAALTPEDLEGKGGAQQHRPYGVDGLRTSNRGIATGTVCPRDDR